MKMIKYITAAVCAVVVIIGSLSSCTEGIDIQQGYGFSVVTLPVPKRLEVGETAEIRCTLVREGIYDGARYFMRYFQPDGRGELRLQDGTVFSPNDLYDVPGDEFRLYYTSASDDNQVIDIYFLDNFGTTFNLSFTFSNEHE